MFNIQHDSCASPCCGNSLVKARSTLMRKKCNQVASNACITSAGRNRHLVPDYITPCDVRSTHGGSLLATEGAREPIEAFVQAIPCGCTRRLNVPLAVTQIV